MSRTYVSKKLREKIAKQARHRCGYCLTSENIVGSPMNVEHIISEAAGGPTIEDNLWLACSECNKHKSDRTQAIDSQTGQLIALFNPRHQVWSEHFEWSKNGELVIAKTATGRVTIETLSINRPLVVNARKIWVLSGWHPPKD